jgi:hypothetical protein
MYNYSVGLEKYELYLTLLDRLFIPDHGITQDQYTIQGYYIACMMNKKGKSIDTSIGMLN